MFSGTAAKGPDYQVTTTMYAPIDTTVNFAAGAATVQLLVLVESDAVEDPSETVVMTVVDGAAYDPGAAASATLTIIGK
jgi:hypothetical protein